jgi:hypothetical protein
MMKERDELAITVSELRRDLEAAQGRIASMEESE